MTAQREDTVYMGRLPFKSCMYVCMYVCMFACICFNCGYNEESMVTHSVGHARMHDTPCGVKMLS